MSRIAGRQDRQDNKFILLILPLAILLILFSPSPKFCRVLHHFINFGRDSVWAKSVKINKTM
jgi:hypothetical protein